MKKYTPKECERAIAWVVKGGDPTEAQLEIIKYFTSQSQRKQQWIANHFSDENYDGAKQWCRDREAQSERIREALKFEDVFFPARLYQLRLLRFVESGCTSDELTAEEMAELRRLCYDSDKELQKKDDIDCRNGVGVFDPALFHYKDRYHEWGMQHNLDPYRTECQPLKSV